MSSRPLAPIVALSALLLLSFATAAAVRPYVPPPGVEYLPGVVFGTGGGRPLRMEMLLPLRVPGSPQPALVFIHGGGWGSGERFGGLNWLEPFAQQGYVCASIEYRLSGEAIFPAQIEDCKCALRYLRAHAGQYNLDPGRIGAWGTSAGGHLAALLGTSGDAAELEGTGGWPKQSSRVQAVCDWFGPADLQDASTFNPEAADSPEALLLGGPICDRMELAEAASPITYISAGDPPFLIMHGDRDKTVPIRQSRLFAAALRAAGVDVTYLTVQGAGHGFPPTPENLEPVQDFFDKNLRR